MPEHYVRVQQEIDARSGGHFTAAERFGSYLVADDPSFAEDLWLHRETAGPFAEKYPEWYRDRWRTDIHAPGLDWWGQDVNPWSHLQDCLGVRRYTVVVPTDAAPSRVMAALDASRVALPDSAVRWGWVDLGALTLGLEAFLVRTALHVRARTDQVLVQLLDFWSSDYVLTTLPVTHLATLETLALQADIYDEGLWVLGNELDRCPKCGGLALERDGDGEGAFHCVACGHDGEFTALDQHFVAAKRSALEAIKAKGHLVVWQRDWHRAQEGGWQIKCRQCGRVGILEAQDGEILFRGTGGDNIFECGCS